MRAQHLGLGRLLREQRRGRGGRPKCEWRGLARQSRDHGVGLAGLGEEACEHGPRLVGSAIV